MRFIAPIVLLAVAGCNPYIVPDTPVDAAAFNTCDPGSPGAGDPSCGGGGGTASTCFRKCNSNVECGGTQQQCRFCNFGECLDQEPTSPPELARCAAECPPGATGRPGWCYFGGCGDALRAAAAAQ